MARGAAGLRGRRPVVPSRRREPERDHNHHGDGIVDLPPTAAAARGLPTRPRVAGASVTILVIIMVKARLLRD